MKIFTVGSKSFVTSFQLAGVPGIISESPQKALEDIRKLTDDSDVGLVLVSDDITESINDELTAVKIFTNSIFAHSNLTLFGRSQIRKG